MCHVNSMPSAFALRQDGSLTIQNQQGLCHQLGPANSPVAMVYRDGFYVMKIPESPKCSEILASS